MVIRGKKKHTDNWQTKQGIYLHHISLYYNLCLFMIINNCNEKEQLQITIMGKEKCNKPGDTVGKITRSEKNYYTSLVLIHAH